MSDRKNIFISHVHEDDALLSRLKDLVARAGMEVSDYSVNSNNPNQAKDPDYIKREILEPRIFWSSTLVVLISHETAQSEWVNWEIRRAVELGKNVIGVYAQGATDADIPDELRKLGDAAIVGWQAERVVDAINGDLHDWDDPRTAEPRKPEWDVKRYSCA